MSLAGASIWGRWRASPHTASWIANRVSSTVSSGLLVAGYRHFREDYRRSALRYTGGGNGDGSVEYDDIYDCVSFCERLELISGPDQNDIASAKVIAGQTVFVFCHSCS